MRSNDAAPAPLLWRLAEIGEAAMTTNRWSKPAIAETAFTPSIFPANRKSRFLQGLTSSELELVVSAATSRSFLANSVVINQGDPADYFFLLTKGCARHFSISEEGRKVLLLWFAAGEIFGGAAVLPEPSPYLFGTEMVKDSCAFVWRRSVIRDLIRHYPSLQENALSIASDYLTW